VLMATHRENRASDRQSVAERWRQFWLLQSWRGRKGRKGAFKLLPTGTAVHSALHSTRNNYLSINSFFVMFGPEVSNAPPCRTRWYPDTTKSQDQNSSPHSWT